MDKFYTYIYREEKEKIIFTSVQIAQTKEGKNIYALSLTVRMYVYASARVCDVFVVCLNLRCPFADGKKSLMAEQKRVEAVTCPFILWSRREWHLAGILAVMVGYSSQVLFWCGYSVFLL